MIILIFNGLDGIMIGQVSLDEDFALDISASGSSCDLSEECGGFFGCSEVWEVESDVGEDGADEGDIGEVQAFRDHLSSDEDINFLILELRENGGVGIFFGS